MLPVFNVNGLHDIGMPVGCSERDGRSLPPARYMRNAMQEYGKRYGKIHTFYWLFNVRTCSKQLLYYCHRPVHYRMEGGAEEAE